MNSTERTTALVSHLTAIQEHLITYQGLAAPFNVSLDLDDHGAHVVIQLDGYGRLSPVAGGLLTWADTLIGVTAQVWRVSVGASVHLSVTGLIDGLSVKVFDATLFEQAVFGDLELGERRPVTLGQLRSWALGTEVAA